MKAVLDEKAHAEADMYNLERLRSGRIRFMDDSDEDSDEDGHWLDRELRENDTGGAQPRKKGRCATISNPTLERLRLHSIVSYSIVWWMQAAQASYRGEAPHQKKGRCATISNPTLNQLRLHSLVSHSIVWLVQAAQAPAWW